MQMTACSDWSNEFLLQKCPAFNSLRAIHDKCYAEARRCLLACLSPRDRPWGKKPRECIGFRGFISLSKVESQSESFENRWIEFTFKNFRDTVGTTWVIGIDSFGEFRRARTEKLWASTTLQQCWPQMVPLFGARSDFVAPTTWFWRRAWQGIPSGARSRERRVQRMLKSKFWFGCPTKCSVSEGAVVGGTKLMRPCIMLVCIAAGESLLHLLADWNQKIACPSFVGCMQEWWERKEWLIVWT